MATQRITSAFGSRKERMSFVQIKNASNIA